MRGKHTKNYPRGSMADANWQQFKAIMSAEKGERRNSARSRAHRLEAMPQYESKAIHTPVMLTDREVKILLDCIAQGFRVVDAAPNEWVELIRKIGSI